MTAAWARGSLRGRHALIAFQASRTRALAAFVCVSRRGSPGCRSRTSWASTMRASTCAKEPSGGHMWRCQPCLLVHYGVFKEQVGLRKVPGKRKTPNPDSGGGLVLLKTVVVRPWHRRIRLSRAALACGFQARGTHRCGYCRSIALLTVVSQWFLSLGSLTTRCIGIVKSQTPLTSIACLSGEHKPGRKVCY